MWVNWVKTQFFKGFFWLGTRARRLQPFLLVSRPRDQLPRAQQLILVALVQGKHLKSHRTADGAKDYRIHAADGQVLETVAANDVHALVEAGLLVGNMKFPAATYLLTEQGLAVARAEGGSAVTPLVPRAGKDEG